MTISLNEPGTLFNDTVNQLDFSVTRSFRSRGVELRPELSLFNMLNANPVLSESTAYPAVGTPLRILEARLIRFQALVRF